MLYVSMLLRIDEYKLIFEDLKQKTLWFKIYILGCLVKTYRFFS